MSIRHGLKWGAGLLVALTLAACSTAQTTSSAQALSEVSSEPIKVLAPAGAPALATLGIRGSSRSGICRGSRSIS